MISNSLPQKELDSSSMSSTPIEKEPVMECPLLLTALSGVTFKVSLSVAKFDRFTDLEDQVMDYLASVTDLQVFGCVIDFLHTTTQTYLEDPIWDKLQQGRECTIVFRDCSVTLLEQEQLGGYPIDQVPLAVHVPMNSEETVPEWAFAGVPRLRHVSVESRIRLILGRPTLATLESTAFLALGFGAVNGQDFPTRRDPLGRFTLFLISQLVSGSRVFLTQGRAGPAGVETAGREHGSCNHAVGE